MAFVELASESALHSALKLQVGDGGPPDRRADGGRRRLYKRKQRLTALREQQGSKMRDGAQMCETILGGESDVVPLAGGEERRRAAAAARRWTTSTSASSSCARFRSRPRRRCASVRRSTLPACDRARPTRAVLKRKVADSTASAAARARTASLGGRRRRGGGGGRAAGRARRQGQGRRPRRRQGRRAAAARRARRRRASTRSSPPSRRCRRRSQRRAAPARRSSICGENCLLENQPHTCRPRASPSRRHDDDELAVGVAGFDLGVRVTEGREREGRRVETELQAVALPPWW